MKKAIFTLTIAALVAMTSCNNGGSQAGGAQLTDSVQAQQAAPETGVTTAAAAPAAAAPTVKPTDLPTPITDFLKQHFPQATVSFVETDNEFGGVEYDVTLSDGTEVDFDKAGQWENVDCHAKAVPAALVPQAIATYVKTNYQGKVITKIDQKPAGYEIELAGGLELKFDKAGQFLGQDD